MPSEVYVFTANVPLLEDGQIPDTPPNSTVRSVLTNSDISRGLAQDIYSNASYRASTVYRYGRDHYIHGLPTSTFFIDNILEPETLAILTAQYGAGVSIQYHKYGDFNGLHHAWQRLIDVHNYDPSTNIVTGLKAEYEATVPAPVYPEIAKVMSDVYLENLVYFSDITPEGTEEPPNPVGNLWGTAPNNRYIPWANTRIGDPNWGGYEGSPYIVAFVTYRVTTTTEVITETDPGDPGAMPPVPPTTVTTYVDTHEYFYETKDITVTAVPEADKYFHTYFTQGGVHRYWIYGSGTGTYPVLDAAEDNSLGDDHGFMPMVIFRNHEKHWAAEENKDDDQHKSATKLMRRMGYSYQTIGDQILENEEIGDIEQAAFLYAIPTGSEDQDSLQYLHTFFKWWGETDPNNLGALQTTPSTSRISEALIDLAYIHQGIVTELVPGTIGDIDFVTETQGSVVKVNPFLALFEDGFNTENANITVTDYVYEKQLADNVIERVTITDLRLQYKISRKYNLSVSTAAGGKVLIPINYNLMTDNFNVNERERIYSRSEHLVFNSKVTVHVSWYETGAFKAFLTVIAIVVIVASLGTTTKFVLTVYAQILAIVGTVAVAVILTAIVLVTINMIVEYGFALVVEALGPKYSLYLAVIAIAVSQFMPSGSVWAKNLLFAGNGLAKASNTEFAALTNEYRLKSAEFKLMAEEKYDEVEKLQRELDSLYNEDVIDSIVMVPLTVPGETPSEYYSRTIETNNIGALVYDIIEYHSELGLALPSFRDSIGNMKDELT